MWKVFNKKSSQEKKPLSEGDVKADSKKGVPATSPVKEISKETAKARIYSRAHAIFLKPLVSEKNSIAASHDIYAFAVRSQANKVEVAKAFRALYNVQPLSVRLMIMPEKRKRYGRVAGVRRAWKKAIVRIPKGAKVDIYAGV